MVYLGQKLKTHCKRGHLRSPENLLKNRGCKLCVKVRESSPKRRDKLALWNASPAKKNYNKYYRRSKIGWTQEKVQQVLIEQDFACAVCREPFIKEPRTDHKHAQTPEPRGLLCNSCNLAIGLLKDSPDTIKAAYEYLLAWSQPKEKQ
jgi:hypothetical protein